jgi:hypothetical protein
MTLQTTTPEALLKDLSQESRLLFILDGGLEPDLEALVRKLDHRLWTAWVYHDTEYNARYHDGPLLVEARTDSPLVNAFIESWAPQHWGGLLLSAQPFDAVLQHLRALRHAQLSGGKPTLLRLHEPRTLRGFTLANLLDAGSNVGATVASGYAMKSAVLAVQRQREILAGNEQKAALMESAAKQADRFMIGWTSAAAFIGALKDLRDIQGQHGNVRTFTIIDTGMQFAEGGIGAGWLFGKQIGSTATKLGMDAAGESLAGFAELDAGPIGIALFAIDILHTLWNGYIERQKAEQKVTDWLDQCLWGKHPAFNDAGQERLEFRRLWQEPHIETQGHLLEQFAKSTIPFVGDQLSMKVPARTITVAFPGWTPQASGYVLSQHQNFAVQGVEQAFSDPGKVIVKDGMGYLTFDTQNSFGDTVVTYWPNAFSDPLTFFEVKN